MADPRTYFEQFSAPPMFGGVGPPRTPGFFNLGQPKGPIEGLAQSLLPMLAEYLRNQYGGAAFTFGQDMNVMSARLAQQYVENMNKARVEGAKLDEPQLRAMMMGMARAMGNDVTDRGVRDAVGRLSGDLGGMLPVLAAMFPDSIDKWLPQGSMTVASASFMSAGRFVYDPVTGVPVSTDPAYGARVMRELMARGPEATSGLGAGRMGQTFEQLVARGLISSGSELGRLNESLQALGGPGMSGPTANAAVREIQADRIKQQLSSYSKVVAAINDIFNDAGRPNAPIGELFAGIEKLTAGGFGTTNATQMAATLRRTQAIANMTGMGLEAQAAITGQLASHLGRYGISGGPVVSAKDYVALTAKTYADLGLISDGPEGQSTDMAAGRLLQLRAAGLASDSTRVAASLLVMGERTGPGTPMRAIADAIRNNQRTARLGDGSEVDVTRLSPEQINAYAAQSGLGTGALQRQLMANGQLVGAMRANPDAVNWYNVTAQSDEARRAFLTAVAYGPSRVDGLTADQYERLWTGLTRRQAVGDYGGSDAGLVAAAIASGDIGPLTDEQRFQLTTALGAVFDGTGHRGLMDVNPEIAGRTADLRRRVDLFARAMGISDWKGRGGLGAKLTRELVAYGTRTAATDLPVIGSLLRGFGMVPKDDVTSALDQVADNPDAAEFLGKLYGVDLFSMSDDRGFFRRNSDRLKKIGAEGKPVAGVDRPASVAISITGAEVTIDRDKKTVTITGGGAIRTGSA